jgi:hypothetical protein
MPRLYQTVSTSWREAARLWSAAVSTSWREGVRLWSTPSAYTMPSLPPGGTLAYPQPPAVASKIIAAANVYSSVHVLAGQDLRDNSPLEVLSATIATDEDSAVWTLRASVSSASWGKLTGGDQPAEVVITIDGIQWAFTVDSVSRSRAFNSDSVTVVGRSLSATAGAPWQAERYWVNTGDINAAQLATYAAAYAAVPVTWEVADWIVPDAVFSITATPLAVVRRLADAIGAVVRSDRINPGLFVSPRYPSLPNEWEVQSADVVVAWEAVETESFERADAPAYDAVYLSGQQAGSFGYARLAGTAGAFLHPFVTDLLLTDEPALRQRATAILGAGGPQARVTLSLPILTGAGEPGVLDLGAVVRVKDPAGEWAGMVRAVTVTAELTQARQQVILERHTSLIEGTEIAP